MNLFQKTNAIGKLGEQIVINYYEQMASVLDVSDDEYFQSLDIDLFINDQAVEVKTGQKIQEYGELPIELVSNTDKCRYKNGWFNTSSADFLIYYSPKENRLYQALFPQLRYYYKINKDTIKTMNVSYNEFGSITKNSIMAYLKIDDLQKSLGKAFRIVNL